MSKERLSNIELLRLLAILFIVMMHAAGLLIGTDHLPNRIVLTAINAVGNMGVTVFILISGYFGIHFRWSRLWTFWAMALCYSLLEYAIIVGTTGVFSPQGPLSCIDSRHVVPLVVSDVLCCHLLPVALP